MTREVFRELVKRGPIILDGATGTELQKKGMEVGVCPEKWILENKEIVIRLQSDYVKAGSNIIYAPTFGANRLKLEDYGLEDKVIEFNKNLVTLSKEAVNNNAYIAGDLAPTGQQIYPIGDISFETIVDVYKEQVQALVEAGVDLFVIETMMSLQETRAAVLAVKESCNLPIMVSMTFDEKGLTLYGTDPLTALITLQNLGVDAVGFNCSTGPAEMLSLVNKIKNYAKVPIITKPNAGLPKISNGATVFDMGAEEFASYSKLLIEA